MANLADIEREALAKMTDFAKDFFQKSFKWTMEETFEAYKRYLIKPWVMRDVSVRDLSTTILGHPISFPVCVSPTAKQYLAHEEGEIGSAMGALQADVAFTLSLWASRSHKEVAKAVPNGLKLFAIQFLTNRSAMLELVRDVEELGFKALVLTCDHPLHINRTTVPIPDIIPDDLLHGVFKDAGHYFNLNGKEIPYTHIHIRHLMDASATWQDVQWLVKQTTLPVIAKGILSESEAERAIQAGVSGILVSNHGARQLDGVMSTLDALPGIVRAVNGRCEVYVDGGIRHGSDVYKALALGARAVFIGRPALYGLAYKGSAGVKEVLDILRKELDTTMALTGCRCIADIVPDRIVRKSLMTSKM